MGRAWAEVEQSIRARPAPEAIAATLGVKPGGIVIDEQRIYRMSSGVVGIVAQNLYPAERFQVSMTLRRSKP